MASEENKSPWLPTLLILTVIQASAFVTVTVFQFRALEDIDEIDISLEHRLQTILSTTQVIFTVKIIYCMVVHFTGQYTWNWFVLILRHTSWFTWLTNFHVFTFFFNLKKKTTKQMTSARSRSCLFCVGVVCITLH